MPEEGSNPSPGTRNDDPTNLFTGRSIDEIGAIEKKIRSGNAFGLVELAFSKKSSA